MTADVREQIRELLPKSASKKTLDALTEWAEQFDTDEPREEWTTVEIQGARCVVQRVEMFGLEFELDASGNAARIILPPGAYAV